MNLFADEILGSHVTVQVKILGRLVVCAMGAVYTDNQNSLCVFLKTLHNYCRMNTQTFIGALFGVRPVTRRLRRTLSELRTITQSQDVLARWDGTLISHLSMFSHLIETVLDGENTSEIVAAFEAITELTILTW
jgi:hypothetical protein